MFTDLELENTSAKFHIARLEAIKIQTRQVAEKTFATELSKVGDMAKIKKLLK